MLREIYLREREKPETVNQKQNDLAIQPDYHLNPADANLSLIIAGLLTYPFYRAFPAF